MRDLDAEDLSRAALLVAGGAGAKDDSADSSSSKSVALLRVGMQGSLQMQKAKLEEAMTVASEKFQAMEKQINDDFSGDMLANLSTAKGDTEKIFDALARAARTAVEKLQKVEIALGKAVSVSELNVCKTNADTESKSFFKHGLTPFNRSFAGLRKAVDLLRRKLSMSHKASGVSVKEPPPPAHAVSVALIAGGELNKTSSSFEAKCGVRAAIVPPQTGTDPAAAIERLAKSKKAFREMAAHLKSNRHGITPVADQTFQKKLEKELKAGFDGCLFAKMTLPDEDWAKRIYCMTFMGHVKEFTMATITPYGCMQNRLLFKGRELLIGLPLVQNPPCTIKDLRKRMMMMTVDAMKQAVVELGGYAIDHGPEDIVVLPSGYLTLVVAVEDCMGLYWSCSSDENDTTRVVQTLTMLVNEFPECANPSTGNLQFKEWLQTL